MKGGTHGSVCPKCDNTQKDVIKIVVKLGEIFRSYPREVYKAYREKYLDVFDVNLDEHDIKKIITPTKDVDNSIFFAEDIEFHHLEIYNTNSTTMAGYRAIYGSETGKIPKWLPQVLVIQRLGEGMVKQNCRNTLGCGTGGFESDPKNDLADYVIEMANDHTENREDNNLVRTIMNSAAEPKGAGKAFFAMMHRNNSFSNPINKALNKKWDAFLSNKSLHPILQTVIAGFILGNKLNINEVWVKAKEKARPSAALSRGDAAEMSSDGGTASVGDETPLLASTSDVNLEIGDATEHDEWMSYVRGETGGRKRKSKKRKRKSKKRKRKSKKRKHKSKRRKSRKMKKRKRRKTRK
tara:strand:+ start:20 stop:1075 length:1056 start_codon:yes stop_codon:yes gene_type:complete